MRGLPAFFGGAVAALALLAGLVLAVPALRERIAAPFSQRSATVVETTLQAVRREQKLLVFAAFVTADVTSTVQKTFLDMAVPGTSVTKTLIVPGLVRYAVDLSTLGDKDLAWDAPTQTLRVRLPPVVPLEPALRLDRMRAYGDKGLLVPMTDAEAIADDLNRAGIASDILAQARTPELMRLAEDAAAEALRNSFLLPLRAAGLEGVSVEVVRPAASAD